MALGHGSWVPIGETEKCLFCGTDAPIYRESSSKKLGMYEHQKPGYTGSCFGPTPEELAATKAKEG